VARAAASRDRKASSMPKTTHAVAGASPTDAFGLDELARSLRPEPPEGNVEYKRRLCHGREGARFQELVTQLLWRVSEGDGEALYQLGIDDDGTAVGLNDEEYATSVDTLRRMSDEIGCDCTLVCERVTRGGGKCATCLVRRRMAKAEHLEVRVTTLGNVDSGKSTLMGVLTRGGLDNGRGLARGGVFRHKHELETGRTSAVSQQILGFAPDGKIVNYANPDVREAHQLRWEQIVMASSKVIHFSDLCGHEKYLKTTMHGVAGTLPAYSLLCVDANRGGIVGMTKEHVSIMLGLKVPFFVIITKIDMASEENKSATIDALMKMLKRPNVHKTPILVRGEDDVLTSVNNIAGGVITPIFQVSCVSGDGMDLIRLFLNHLPSRKIYKALDGEQAVVYLDDSFTVTGIGTVVSGLVTSGKVETHDNLLLGPDGNGSFLPVQIKSAMNKRVLVEHVQTGNTGSFAIRPKKGHLHKHDVRKGMILCAPDLKPKATWAFTAEVIILSHPTTLRCGYSPILHCVSVRQAARINGIEGKDLLRMGDRATVHFEWCHRPEFMIPGSRIIFREGRTKGIGVVRSISPDSARTFNPKTMGHSAVSKSPVFTTVGV